MKYRDYLISFGITIILFGILALLIYQGTITITNSNYNYILSSIAQGLASLVALLFVITFFLCQSTGRVSLLSQVLKPDGYIILVVFTISIIAPLILMSFEKINWITVYILIFMAVFSLILLFFFINAINEKMEKFGIRNIAAELRGMRGNVGSNPLRYEELLDDLLNINTSKILLLESNTTTKKIVDELNNAISQKLSDFEIKRKSLNKMIEIGNKSYRQGRGIDIIKKVINRMNLFIKNNFKKDDEESQKLLFFHLKAVVKLFKGIKHKKEELENAKELIAKILIKKAAILCNLLKQGRDITNEKNLSILLSSLKYWEEKRIMGFDKFINLRDGAFPTSVDYINKEEFKKILLKIKDSNITFKEESFEEFSTSFDSIIQEN